MKSVAQGPFLLWTANRDDAKVAPATANEPRPEQDPSAKQACRILFEPNAPATPATPGQLDVRERIKRIVGQLEFLYGAGDPAAESKFREQYAEVFALGQQALETGQGDAAKAVERLDAIEGDLITEEWTRVLDDRKQKIAQAAAAASGLARGPFLLFTCSESGRALNKPADGSHPRQDRHDERARQIIYCANPGAQAPTAEEMKVHDRVDRILHALCHLYQPGDPAAEAKFRKFYAALFGVARMALEEKGYEPTAAMKELDVIEKDLVDDQGPVVKTKKIKGQLWTAFWFAVPLGLTWIILRQISNNGEIGQFVQRLGVTPLVAANVMLLLIGSFIGVCVSYAYRKPDFKTADDLVAADRDQLLPWLRLVLIGTLSLLLMLFARAGIANLTIGTTFALSGILSGGQTPAFVVGALCGIGEQFLPNTVMATKSFLGPSSSKGGDATKTP